MAIEKRSKKVGDLNWCYLDVEPSSPEDRPPVLLLHGILAQSYSWRPVMEAIAQNGQRAIAPDWLGYGLSDKPAPRDFPFDPDAYVEALGNFVDALPFDRLALVVQGFLGSVGIQYALAHPDRIDRLAIVNAPFYNRAKLPWKLAQLGLPLAGEMLTQDPLCVDRTLEGGGGKVVSDEDLNVYRKPYLMSSQAGTALLASVRNCKLKESMAAIAAGLADWQTPTLVAWGSNDKWLAAKDAEAATEALPKGEFRKIEGAGHYAQIDDPDRLSDLIPTFLRRQVF